MQWAPFFTCPNLGNVRCLCPSRYKWRYTLFSACPSLGNGHFHCPSCYKWYTLFSTCPNLGNVHCHYPSQYKWYTLFSPVPVLAVATVSCWSPPCSSSFLFYLFPIVRRRRKVTLPSSLSTFILSPRGPVTSVLQSHFQHNHHCLLRRPSFTSSGLISCPRGKEWNVPGNWLIKSELPSLVFHKHES